MFKVDDTKDLALQLVRLLTDERLRATLSSEARQLCIEKYSSTVATKELESLYEKLLADTRRISAISMDTGN